MICVQTLLRKEKNYNKANIENNMVGIGGYANSLEETRMSYARSASFLVMGLINAEIGLIILLFQNKAKVLQEA